LTYNFGWDYNVGDAIVNFVAGRKLLSLANNTMKIKTKEEKSMTTNSSGSKPETIQAFREHTAPFRVETKNRDGRVVSDRIYLTEGGVTKALKVTTIQHDVFGWSATVFDRAADGTWTARGLKD